MRRYRTPLTPDCQALIRGCFRKQQQQLMRELFAYKEHTKQGDKLLCFLIFSLLKFPGTCIADCIAALRTNCLPSCLEFELTSEIT